MRRETIHSPAHRAVAEALAAARKRAGLSQRALAARLGQLPSTVAKMELGDRRLNLVELVRLAEALGEDPRCLVVEMVDAVSRSEATEGDAAGAK